jgi:hypothetical protein
LIQNNYNWVTINFHFQAKCLSKWKPLKHEDTLQINCTRFDLHIHNGTDTCDKCEPGQVIASKEPGILCKSGQVIA